MDNSPSLAAAYAAANIAVVDANGQFFIYQRLSPIAGVERSLYQ